MLKKQASENEYLTISQAAQVLGWSRFTVRRHIQRFNRYPRGNAVSYTPGGHLRILRDAVIWLQGTLAVPTTADELIQDLRD